MRTKISETPGLDSLFVPSYDERSLSLSALATRLRIAGEKQQNPGSSEKSDRGFVMSRITLIHVP